MRKILKEFKEFAFKGNVIDMAVGVVIGTAFSAIVNSVVNDIFMPMLSLLIGRIDFSTLEWKLGEGATAAAIKYGAFLQTVINFLVIALCIFAFVKMLNQLRKPEEKVEAAPARTCMYCKQEIDQAATRCPYCTSEV